MNLKGNHEDIIDFLQTVRKMPELYGIENRKIMSYTRWLFITRYIDLGQNVMTDKCVNGIILRRHSDKTVIKTVDLRLKLRPVIDGLNLVFGKYKTLDRERSIGNAFFPGIV